MSTRKKTTSQPLTRAYLEEFAQRYGAELRQNVVSRVFSLHKAGDEETMVFVLDPHTTEPVRYIRNYTRAEWEAAILHNVLRLMEKKND